jgi:hypothetical protein
MMVAEGTEIGRCILVYDKVYFVSVHLVVFVDPCIIVQFIQQIQQDATAYQHFISYLYEAQHVSGDTPPIIMSLKLH